MRLAPALMLMIWAGAAAAQEVAMTEDMLPPGYPPKIGEIAGTVGSKARAWEFFDFSVGAFDASAQISADGYSVATDEYDNDSDQRHLNLYLTGYPPGDPDADRGRISVRGELGMVLSPGPVPVVLVELPRGKDRDGPRLSSSGQQMQVVIDSIGPAQPDSYMRHVTGHIEGRVCPVNWPFKSCQDIALRFDTDVQMSSTVVVKD